jgi:DNA-binding transcriptional MerR regulator
MSETQQTIKQVDAAKRYGVTDRTIRRWEREKLIQGKRVCGVKLYPVKALDELCGVSEEQR